MLGRPSGCGDRMEGRISKIYLLKVRDLGDRTGGGQLRLSLFGRPGDDGVE